MTPTASSLMTSAAETGITISADQTTSNVVMPSTTMASQIMTVISAATGLVTLTLSATTSSDSIPASGSSSSFPGSILSVTSSSSHLPLLQLPPPPPPDTDDDGLVDLVQSFHTPSRSSTIRRVDPDDPTQALRRKVQPLRVESLCGRPGTTLSLNDHSDYR